MKKWFFVFCLAFVVLFASIVISASSNYGKLMMGPSGSPTLSKMQVADEICGKCHGRYGYDVSRTGIVCSEQSSMNGKAGKDCTEIITCMNNCGNGLCDKGASYSWGLGSPGSANSCIEDSSSCKDCMAKKVNNKKVKKNRR